MDASVSDIMVYLTKHINIKILNQQVPYSDLITNEPYFAGLKMLITVKIGVLVMS